MYKPFSNISEVSHRRQVNSQYRPNTFRIIDPNVGDDSVKSILSNPVGSMDKSIEERLEPRNKPHTSDMGNISSNVATVMAPINTVGERNNEELHSHSYLHSQPENSQYENNYEDQLRRQVAQERIGYENSQIQQDEKAYMQQRENLAAQQAYYENQKQLLEQQQQQQQQMSDHQSHPQMMGEQPPQEYLQQQQQMMIDEQQRQQMIHDQQQQIHDQQQQIPQSQSNQSFINRENSHHSLSKAISRDQIVNDQTPSKFIDEQAAMQQQNLDNPNQLINSPYKTAPATRYSRRTAFNRYEIDEHFLGKKVEMKKQQWSKHFDGPAQYETEYNQNTQKSVKDLSPDEKKRYGRKVYTPTRDDTEGILPGSQDLHKNVSANNGRFRNSIPKTPNRPESGDASMWNILQPNK
ncbi:hypothetical protein SNEBB_011165 [Seison nebaliae]|nr:hypothetical protein SNEBB_011165 [Seison nebaliae]